MRRPLLLFLAVFVATFVAFYPYLDGIGLCISGGCPDAQPASSAISGGLSSVCLLIATLGSSVGVATLTLGRQSPNVAGRRVTQLYLTPDSPPPQSL